MIKNKIVLVYHNLDGVIEEETIWVTSDGNNYKVGNIPFYAPNLALNDIVSVENDEGILYFDELIRPSGHSTIQIIFLNQEEIERVIKVIEKMGCHWESLENQPYFAIDIPPNINYKELRKFLDQEVDSGILDFKEACLSGNHT